MAAKKDSRCAALAHSRDRVAQAGAIALRLAWKRRAGSPLLAKGKIAAQDGVAMSGKSFAERHQQWGSAIRARAVRQDKSIAVRICGRVQKAANGGV